MNLLWRNMKQQVWKLKTSPNRSSNQQRQKLAAKEYISSAIQSKAQRSKLHSWRELWATHASQEWRKATTHQLLSNKLIDREPERLSRTWKSAKDSRTRGSTPRTSSTGEDRGSSERRWSPQSFKNLSSPRSWQAPGWGQRHSPPRPTKTTC